MIHEYERRIYNSMAVRFFLLFAIAVKNVAAANIGFNLIVDKSFLSLP